MVYETREQRATPSWRHLPKLLAGLCFLAAQFGLVGLLIFAFAVVLIVN
jgi:hypothetical protein